jgi:dihydroorotate dehydrogenase electron transfer subunit
MPYYQDNYKIESIESFNSSCFDMRIHCPKIAEEAKAGQFVHIQCEGKTLRRPISICEINKDNGIIRLVFDIRGEGTQWLSDRKKGETLNVLGPLGNGFDLSNTNKKVLFIGGGMGSPPLLEAAKAFNGNADAILGFKCLGNSMLVNDFNNCCSDVLLTSDDGTLGEKGFVTSTLIKRIQNTKYDILYSCGPLAMLKAVSKIALENSIECYVSMEERMACGVGACLVCACKVKVNNKEAYKHVCKDGPVFNAKEIVW